MLWSMVSNAAGMSNTTRMQAEPWSNGYKACLFALKVGLFPKKNIPNNGIDVGIACG